MIIVECNNDRELMYRMGFTPDQVEHEFGRPRVLDKVRDEREVIGIVDEDPRADESEYLREEYTEREVKGKIKLLICKHNYEKRVIQISPYLEDWLYGVARRNRISPEGFGLPVAPERLHVMSLRHRKHMQNFQRFVDSLRDTRDDEINTLREWIREAIAE